MGDERAARYLRKFYPWYVERIGGSRALQAAVQQAGSIEDVRALMRGGGGAGAGAGPGVQLAA
jgi:hypothetical protein